MPDPSTRPAPRSLAWLWNNGSLTIVMFGTFIGLWIGLMFTGWYTWNSELSDHHQPAISLWQYLHNGHLWEATFENWEGEFLPMAAFTFLTAKLVQKGSPESREPDEPIGPVEHTDESPWPTHRGPVICWLYCYSLTLALFACFLICLFLHIWTGTCLASDENVLHGEAPLTIGEFICTSTFWFESFQNYQSEFLANGVMVVLAIFLRQKGSPESKRVNTPTWESDK